MNYFDRPEISASDLKNFLRKLGGQLSDPVNLEAIFEFGSMFHSTIIEPHLSSGYNVTNEQTALALKMRSTFFKDSLNRMIIMREDFQREKAFSKVIEVGGMQYTARCKCDGISKGISTVLEIKGLSLTTQKQFDEAIDRLHYNLACVHYLLTTECKMMLIVGISKIKPELMFRKIIKKHDENYLIGEQKLIDTLHLLREFSPEDVQLVA